MGGGGRNIARETGFPVGTEGRLADFSALVGTGISNAETRAELAASRARVVAASDEHGGGWSATCTTARSSASSAWGSRFDRSN